MKGGESAMLIQLNNGSEIPIYVQLRNQIVTGIGRGDLKEGERLPTVRQLAQDAEVNTMTVNKAYQLLKTEGFITIDRRRGATVSPVQQSDRRYREKLEAELELLSAEARMKGMEQTEFLELCERVFAGMQPA
jgi:GntR family transcriptional regulator